MTLKTFIDTGTLAKHLADTDLVVVDCRFNLTDPDWGEWQYRRSHIPGAVYAHLDRDLSGKKSGLNGRHPLPDPQTLARTLGAMGVDRTVQVVAYDLDDGSFASRLWWLVKWLGHDGVAVLDGGFSRWIDEGRPTASGDQTRETRVFVASRRDEMAADLDDVAHIVRSGGGRLVDARAPERYRGEVEPIDPVAGHIPGAVNHHFRRNVDETGRLRPVAELREQFARTIGGTAPDRVICYCGSGVTACQNVLALEHIGVHGVKLYPGSWSEWSSDPSRGVATG